MFGVAGSYFLNVSFGNTPINLDPSQIREFTIVQDLNKFLPELRMRISDQSGGFTHLIPFDQGMSKIQIICGEDISNPITQTYLFDVYRRTPTSEAVLRGEYDIVGLLAVPNLFSPLYKQGYNQNINTTIQQIGELLNISNFNISSSLAFTKNLIQANWSNAQFLQQIAENISSENDDSNYRCWISVQNSVQNTLNFQSYSDLLNEDIKYTFAFGDETYPPNSDNPVYPVYNYEIVDNYKYLQILGTQQQSRIYFNYTTSQWVAPIIPLEDIESLTPYFMVDSNDPTIDQQYTYTGRSNSLTSDFYGKVNSVYETRLNNLVKIWITTWGNFDIRPGNLIQLEVPSDPSNSLNYQYSGYWLVERIILSFDDTIRMKLLLTRSGIATSTQTTLLPATNIVQGS